MRKLVLCLSLVLVAACGDEKKEDTVQGAPVVLVHGAWMGSWCWSDVAARLRAQGREVTTVNLPAHGDDPSPAAAATMQGYVDAVLAAVNAARGPVVLVGHSMGGMVITQVAEALPAKVAHLVYVGAYLPHDGQSLFDLASTDAESHLPPVLQVDQASGLAKVPAADLTDVFVADGTAANQALLAEHYRDEPLAPFLTPAHVTAGGWGSVKMSYIFTRDDHAISLSLQQRMTSGVELASVATLDSGHSPFLSQPDALVSVLAGL